MAMGQSLGPQTERKRQTELDQHQEAAIANWG